jgi:heterotetrameric sarcosine oxidase delta subunit
MRITCPLCGPRDLREFYYYGSDDYLNMPEVGDADAIDAHLHLRANPAGMLRELWYHEAGCASWLAVTRNTVTHEVLGAALLADAGSGICAKMKPEGGS